MDLASLRGRLYLLTKIAAAIQAENIARDDNLKINLDVTSTKSTPDTEIRAQQRLLNHLAVLSSRGGENDRAVATYTGPVLAKKFTVVVASAAASTDQKELSIFIGPRESLVPAAPPLALLPSSQSRLFQSYIPYTSHIHPAESKLHQRSGDRSCDPITGEVSLSHLYTGSFLTYYFSEHLELPVTRKENHRRVGVAEEELADVVEAILNNPEELLDYHTYIQNSMCILRHTALVVAKRGDDDKDFQGRAMNFFLAQCRPKIRSRLREVDNVYLQDVSAFESWTKSVEPTLPTYATRPVPAKDIFFFRFMMDSAIPSKESGANHRVFLLSSSSFPTWISIILRLITSVEQVLEELEETSHNLAELSIILQTLHKMINLAPAQLWTIPPLNDYLKSRRLKAKADDKQDKDERGDEDEQLEDALLIQTSATDPPLPECSLFLRAVDAICAWTTAVQKLVSLPYFGAEGMMLDIHVIDLAQCELTEPTLDTALSVWGLEEHSAEIRGLSDEINRCKGRVHCEAGLLASLLYSTTPTNALEGFNFPSIPKQKQHIIGVAKKCCLACRHLVTTLERIWEVKLQLPGNHSRYHAWYPPDLLPNVVLEEVEQQVLWQVKRMLEENKGSASCASSVTSDDLQLFNENKKLREEEVEVFEDMLEAFRV